MKPAFFLLVLASILPASAESLRYTINWQSGLSLGEATLRSDRVREQGAEKGREQWDFDLSIDASVPGYAVRDHYHSTASSDFCSSELEKNYVHGKRKSEEKVSFDQQKLTATRQTLNGGKSDISVSSCARNAISSGSSATNTGNTRRGAAATSDGETMVMSDKGGAPPGAMSWAMPLPDLKFTTSLPPPMSIAP